MGRPQIVDSEMVLKMFSDKSGEALIMFEKYTIEVSADKCLEIEEDKVTVSDDDLRKKDKATFRD